MTGQSVSSVEVRSYCHLEFHNNKVPGFHRYVINSQALQKYYHKNNLYPSLRQIMSLDKAFCCALVLLIEKLSSKAIARVYPHTV